MQRVVLSEYDENGQSSIGNSAVSVSAVTTSDSATINPTKGLYIGVTGDVVVTMKDGSSATFKAMPVGMYYLSVTKVKATGTTATNILALY